MRRFLSVTVALLAIAPAFGDKSPAMDPVVYLRSLQNKDGGFRPSAAVETSSLRATSSALRALKYFGGIVPAADAAEFIKKCHDKTTGGFADTPGGKPNVATTAIGLMALVEAKIPTEPYEAGAIKYLGDNAKTFEDIRIAVAGLEAVGKKAPEFGKWQKQIEDAKLLAAEKSDGAARVLGGALVAMMRMGFNPDPNIRMSALAELNVGQRKDGGFGKADVTGSDLETSYRVMRCYHMLKKQPEGAAKLREFVARCHNADGGYGVMPGEKSAVGSTYFAAIILHWLNEK